MPALPRRATLALALALAACHGGSAGAPDGGAPADAASIDAGPTDGTCPAGGAGIACIFALYDEVVAGCAPARLADLVTSLGRRHGELPLWLDGRAVFISQGKSVAVAGEWNAWATSEVTAPLCASELYTLEQAIPSGLWRYKLVDGATWSLDPEDWAFAYDDFTGNPDGRNSVLDTFDSGVGHLVQPPDLLCSDALGNCRPLTTYLPPGYDAPASANRAYPVVFMHDGQNLYDDHDCCFGHTGWEVNLALDKAIAEGTASDLVIVGFDHGGDQRIAEYGGALTDAFMDFQVHTVQPRAAALWRLDPARVYTAGSSLGGLIAFRLAFAYPEIYAGAASLSGAFWFGQDTGTTMREILATKGKLPLALYLDHGGTEADGGDDLADSVELRDLLGAAGWQRHDSPDCTLSPDTLCYHHEVGAIHNELAWRDRAWRFLTFLAPP